jgi:hypothetical protein
MRRKEMKMFIIYTGVGNNKYRVHKIFPGLPLTMLKPASRK